MPGQVVLPAIRRLERRDLAALRLRLVLIGVLQGGRHAQVLLQVLGALDGYALGDGVELLQRLALETEPVWPSSSS